MTLFIAINEKRQSIFQPDEEQSFWEKGMDIASGLVSPYRTSYIQDGG